MPRRNVKEAEVGNVSRFVGTAHGGVVATGGTVTDVDGYRIHTFTNDGTFTVSATGTVEVLVVAGGGGGGKQVGGGGGAGGFQTNAAFPTLSGAYTVKVGAGGQGGQTTGAPGAKGSDSVFSNGASYIVSVGGGGGGTYNGVAATIGGSGGGGGNTGGGKAGTAGQGNKGGDGTTGTYTGGGGGGVRIEGGILRNCTIVSNRADGVQMGGGVNRSGGVLVNDVIYFNTATTGPDYNGSEAYVTNPCSPDLTAGVQGNITNNPSFMAPALADFHIHLDSPCLSAGLMEAWMTNAFDLDGLPRLRGRADMGAYECTETGGTAFTFR